MFGGELTDLEHIEFRDLKKLDIVGMYPDYASAYAAWKGKAQGSVDNALMRYFIVHLHRLIDPETAGP
ncbi:inositol monophosphatase [Camelimonas fluminis]|nr:inositol monophosphatase [Camelimonas fluminis]